MSLIFQPNFSYDGHKENRWDMLLRFLLLVLFPTFRMRLDDTHSSRRSVLTSLPVLWLGYTTSRTQKYMHAEFLCWWVFIVLLFFSRFIGGEVVGFWFLWIKWFTDGYSIWWFFKGNWMVSDLPEKKWLCSVRALYPNEVDVI